ncbi:hypothetical protein GF373_02055 [bacterium]|nr:hypothetical protein [bacterium]
MLKQSIFIFMMLLTVMSSTQAERNYKFDGEMSEKVLRNYLSRSATFGELLNRTRVENELGGNTADNIRMLVNTGNKFAGRAIYMWGNETRIDSLLKVGETVAQQVHEADPDVILQAAAFEIVSTNVNQIPIPAWVFEDFGLESQARTFNYNKMLYPDGHRVDQWYQGASVPDMSQRETRLWFYFLAASYIRIGCEAIHFGQVEIMDDREPHHVGWLEMLNRVRAFAKQHARRQFVLCDAHVPSGGIVEDGKLLFDFHSFPLRIEEVAGRPQQGILQVGHIDSFYGRSKGGVTPSGWPCEHLPYLAEVDNFGGSGREGQNTHDAFIWGYDEIVWFANQPKSYRDVWLRYAWHWLRHTDPAGYLQMPLSRVLYRGVDGRNWYWANRPSEAVPGGFDQEATIKSIWDLDRS